MIEKADIVVVGGGISGCALAYELARAGLGKIGLVEAGDIASATTGESGGYIRKFNTDPYLGKLASESFDYYQNFAQEVGGSCNFRKTGLVSRVARADLPKLEGQIVQLQNAGHEIIVTSLPPTTSLRQANYANNGDLFIYEPGLGNIDTKLACRSWVAAAERKSARIYENTPVEKILFKSGAVKGIETARGQIECDKVILSAGAWSRRLLANLPVEMPGITARSFQYNIYVGAARFLDTAFMDNLEGFYTAPFRNGDVFAGTLGEDRLVSDFKYDHANDPQAAERLHQLMIKHFSFVKFAERILVKRSYDAYTEDGRGLAKSFPELSGLILASGWSSGGIKSAPAIARQVTKMVTSRDVIAIEGGAYANTKS